MNTTKLVKDTYNKIAERYTDKYFSDDTDFPYLDKFLSFLPKNSKILDIGSGPGNFSEYIYSKDFVVEGIDLSDEMIKIARKKVPQVKFQLMDMRDIKYLDNYFNGLICLYSLIHISSNDIPSTLNGFNRILKSDGYIFLITQAGEPDRVVKEALSEGDDMFINFFTRKRLKDFLENAGFEVISQKEKQKVSAFSNRVIYTIAEKKEY